MFGDTLLPSISIAFPLLLYSPNKDGQWDPRRARAHDQCVSMCVVGVSVQRDTRRHKALSLMRLGFD